MATNTPQTIAYPSPGARPRRQDGEPLAPHVIVLFGATGDLAKRKLLPGMAYLVQSKLAPKIRVVGTSLEDLSEDEFRRQFEYLVAHEPPPLAVDEHGERLAASKG